MIDGFIIEPVSEGDFDALRTLFVSALEAHYDGDHAAHLARLFDAYRINGRDANGYNSLAQLGYVARRETGGPPVGGQVRWSGVAVLSESLGWGTVSGLGEGVYHLGVRS